MSYDVPYRFHQALDPSSLVTLQATLHAISAGVQDCRNAGCEPARDPAIALLVRHLGQLVRDLGTDEQVKRTCAERIAELERCPALLTLSYRGVAFDKAAKDRFHKDAHKALRAFAAEWGLAEPEFQIGHFPGEIAISGDVTLTSADFEISVSVGPLHAGCEVRYFARRGVAARERMRHAPLAVLLSPRRLASRIRRDLRLDQRLAEPVRPLVA